MSKVRVTSRTDTRGTVNQEFRGLFEVSALENARKAGIPARLLHPSGWDGDEEDVTGLFAEMIYRLGELPINGPTDMSDAELIIKQMVSLCENFGVDHRQAIPFDYPRFIRDLRVNRVKLKAIDNGTGVPDPVSEAEVCWGQW